MNPNSFLLFWALATFILINVLVIYIFGVGGDNFINKFKININKLSTAFFKDEDTIHEPILFFISNSTVIVFLSLALQFIGNGKTAIPKGYFLPEILVYFLYVIIIYVFSITIGRIVVTLSAREVHPVIIGFFVILMVATLILFERLQ